MANETKNIFTDGKKLEAMDMYLATQISDALNRHYPGHLWAVNVNSEGGVVIIKNFNVSYRYGYLLKLRDVYLDTNYRLCINAGGEILERANIRRGRWDVGEKAKKVDGQPEKHQPLVYDNDKVIIV